MHHYDIKLIFGTGWWLRGLLLHYHGLARYCSTSGNGPTPFGEFIINQRQKHDQLFISVYFPIWVDASLCSIRWLMHLPPGKFGKIRKKGKKKSAFNMKKSVLFLKSGTACYMENFSRALRARTLKITALWILQKSFWLRRNPPLHDCPPPHFCLLSV